MDSREHRHNTTSSGRYRSSHQGGYGERPSRSTYRTSSVQRTSAARRGSSRATASSRQYASSRGSAPVRRSGSRSGLRDTSRNSYINRTSNKNRLIILIGVVLIAAIVLLIAATQCSASEPETTVQNDSSNLSSDDTNNASDKDNANEPDTSNSSTLTPDRQALLRILDAEDVESLIALAETNEDALWIAAHPEEYAFEGPEVQYKILKLAANDEAALKYVREFPEKYPASDETTDISLAMSAKSPSASVPNTQIPHLYQWDRRWAQTIYCSTTFGLTGCGPTALAMIYQGLTGDDSIDPYDLSLMAQNAGYMLQFDGTTDGFFTQTANELGLDYETPVPTVENITNALANGKPIIANFAPGYFTRYGHFVVLTGLDSNGNIIMNDPYSVVRSSQTWDPELIANETRKMFVYSV